MRPLPCCIRHIAKQHFCTPFAAKSSTVAFVYFFHGMYWQSYGVDSCVVGGEYSCCVRINYVLFDDHTCFIWTMTAYVKCGAFVCQQLCQ